MSKGIIKKYEDYAVITEPYYEEIAGEITDFKIAYKNKRPLALVGPTGCGKTTFTEYMAYRLRQDLVTVGKGKSQVAEISKAEKQANGDLMFPYIEVPCHEDMTETHLVGRKGLNGEWIPGPAYIAAANGGLLVLDEIVEARKDLVVLLHGLTDDRRILHVSKNGEVVIPPDNFMTVVCYNPGYQVRAKNLKPSTRQRFPTISMDYAPPALEKKIITRKTNVPENIAAKLVSLADNIRAAKSNESIQLQEGASTRLLIMAAEYYNSYIELGKEKPDLEHIARITIFNPISTEDTDREALEELLKAI